MRFLFHVLLYIQVVAIQQYSAQKIDKYELNLFETFLEQKSLDNVLVIAEAGQNCLSDENNENTFYNRSGWAASFVEYYW